MESGAGVQSGHFESFERLRGRSGQRSGGQAEMVKNLGTHPEFLDDGDDFQLAPAVRAVLDIEHPFQQSSPVDANRCQGMERIVLGIEGVLFDILRVGNNLGAQFKIRCQYPMDANEIEPWTRY